VAFYQEELRTQGRDEMVDITRKVQSRIQASQCQEGVCVVYSPHTTAGITINEAYDSDVKRDILTALDRVFPWTGDYHHAEGNSAAHLKTSFTGPSVSIPIHKGEPVLGTWQGIYFCEFDGPRSRRYTIQIIGD